MISRRRFLQIGTVSALGSLGAAEKGYAEARSLPSVRMAALELPGLPVAWDGLAIAQVSDVHAGPRMDRDRMRRIRDLVMSLSADLIVFTGDQMDRRPEDAEAFGPGFSGLEAPFGVYGVLGNHDHFIDPAISEQALRTAGIRPLINASVTLVRDGEPLHLVGLEDLAAIPGRFPDFGAIRRAGPMTAMVQRHRSRNASGHAPAEAALPSTARAAWGSPWSRSRKTRCR